MSIVQTIGPWREDLTLNNDAEYFTRALLGSKKVLFCDGARCRYRSGISGSLSGQKATQHWRSQALVIKLCAERVLAREDSDRLRRAFAKSWQHLAHACYAYEPSLAESALAQARNLHPVRISPDGGPAFRLLSQLIGWRAARLLQLASGRI